jgi:hypothetical protein
LDLPPAEVGEEGKDEVKVVEEAAAEVGEERNSNQPKVKLESSSAPT